MKIAVFVHTANPLVDPPLCHLSRSRVRAMAANGVVAILSRRAAQYTSDRTEYVPPSIQRITESGYDRTVTRGRALVWVRSGLTWQMKPMFGSAARRFTQTRAGMNFSPNRTTSPSEHAAG